MRALRATLRALPAPVWALFAGTLINRFGSFVLVFLVLYLTRLGYSVAEAGAAVSVYGIGSVAAATAGGHLADRLGRRNAIALSMFLGRGGDARALPGPRAVGRDRPHRTRRLHGGDVPARRERAARRPHAHGAARDGVRALPARD